MNSKSTSQDPNLISQKITTTITIQVLSSTPTILNLISLTTSQIKITESTSNSILSTTSISSITSTTVFIILPTTTVLTTTSTTAITTTTPKLLFDDVCIKTEDCSVDRGLSCPTGKCTCAIPNKYWNGWNCVDTLTYNKETCTNSTQCRSPMVCLLSGTSCNCPDNVANGKCDCPTRTIGNEYYSDGNTCLQALPVGSKCLQNNECQYLTQNTFCNGICECDSTRYYNTVSKKCENLVSNNAPCTQIDACNSVLGLTCQIGFCKCNSADKFWNGTTCTYTVNYLINQLVNGKLLKLSEN